MCCFKFRLWNCLSYSQNSETAGLHKAIINIKRSRRQAVTALNIIVIANYPFEKHYILASLVKGRWIDGKAQVLILLLSACDMPIIFMLQTFCRQDGWIASPPPFAPHQPFQNRTITLAFRSAIVCVCLYGFTFALSPSLFVGERACFSRCTNLSIPTTLSKVHPPPRLAQTSSPYERSVCFASLQLWSQSPHVLAGIENKHFFEKTDFFYKLKRSR